MGGLRTSLQMAVGCVVVSSVHAAEWSAAPELSLSMDHASNRYLSPTAVPGQGAVITFNALLARTTPNLDISLQPTVSVQRYTTGSAADTTDRSINVTTNWSREKSTFNLTGGYSDLSTLTSELASTGVIQGSTRQRQAAAQGSWQLQESEHMQLNVAPGYTDVSYTGLASDQLAGYRYPTLSIAQRMSFWSQTSLTVSASGSDLHSRSFTGSMVDAELSVSVEHTFSDLLSGLASIGASERSQNGSHNRGEVGQLRLTRKGERNRYDLSYARTVTPNGFGGLVQRDQASVSVSRELSPHLNGSAALLDTRDHEVFSLLLLEESRRYESAVLGLDWLAGESSTIGVQAGVDHATNSGAFAIPPAKGWHAGLTYTWKPLPSTFSR